MQKKNNYFLIFFITALLITVVSKSLSAQLKLSGDFKLRWVSDSFKDAIDDRDKENYMRFLGQIRGKFEAAKDVTINTEVTTMIINGSNTVRNIIGTGNMQYLVSKFYAQIDRKNLLFLDKFRLRVGRQPFELGKGLTFGDSYYFMNKFDGGRVDLTYNNYTLTLFGAITGQNVSDNQLYPEPGSDQIYAASLKTQVLKQHVSAYYVTQKMRGSFNDNEVFGACAYGKFLNKKLEYFGEFGYQNYNTSPGLPKKGGIGYMGGLSYSFPLGPFRTVKLETRYAAFQGDDSKTEKTETFSPPYPSFFWGDRIGYVNGEIGGTYPYKGRNIEGSRLWYSRIYLVPRFLPALRFQFQYLKVDEYVNNDNYNSFNDEFSIRLYYHLYKNTRFEFRFTKGIPNGEDKDLNNNGTITSSEDAYSYTRFQLGLNISF